MNGSIVTLRDPLWPLIAYPGEANGRVIYALKRPFSEGTTHFVFDPLEFLAKLAALIPRPRVNLTRYHGVLALNAKYRKLVVPRRRTKTKRKHTTPLAPPLAETEHPLAPLSRAERLKRVFKIDITQCPRCGGKLRVIATITQSDVIQKILGHGGCPASEASA